MPMKAADGAEPATLACYCEKHLPVTINYNVAYFPYINATRKSNKPHMKLTLTELEVTSPNSSFEFDDASRSIKRVWAYVETYKLGPPRTCRSNSATHYGIYRESYLSKEARFCSSCLSLLELEAKARQGGLLL